MGAPAVFVRRAADVRLVGEFGDRPHEEGRRIDGHVEEVGLAWVGRAERQSSSHSWSAASIAYSEPATNFDAFEPSMARWRPTVDDGRYWRLSVVNSEGMSYTKMRNGDPFARDGSFCCSCTGFDVAGGRAEAVAREVVASAAEPRCC